MAMLTNFFTISSDADPGQNIAALEIPAAPGLPSFVDLPFGAYKIAAVGSDLLWKLGPTELTAATGASLSAGDQEVIIVTTPLGERLWFARGNFASDDGEINIVPVQVYNIPGRDFREYTP